MKKKIRRKLTLHRESLHELGQPALRLPAAAGSGTRNCATCPPFHCPQP